MWHGDSRKDVQILYGSGRLFQVWVRLRVSYTPKKDIKLYAYSLQTVLGKSIVLFGGFGRQ